MFERFAKALKVAVRDEGFAQILGTGLLLVLVGTLTYTTSQDWSLVDGFYFAVATLTTSSIADPQLVITGAPIKIFTVFYILVGIGILVELARQLGFAYVDVRRAERARRPPTQTKQPERNGACAPSVGRWEVRVAAYRGTRSSSLSRSNVARLSPG